MIRSTGIAALLPFLSALIWGQAVTANQAFEVSTIKPSSPDANGRFFRLASPRRFEAYNHTLKESIGYAYSLTPALIIGGPPWIDSDRYDTVGETAEPVANVAVTSAMFRTLLGERYRLTFHREQKQMNVYNLVVGKDGPKMKESPAGKDGRPSLMINGPPRAFKLPGRNATMAELAGLMQRVIVDRPVVDMTGLTARYDFDLLWTSGVGTEDNGTPDIFGAMQQLGLRLEPGKAMVETFVIDHVERPDAN
jgi:uncharacterized protein (TIGR03435 family)